LYENDLAELKEGVTDIRHQHFRFLFLLHNARTTGISPLIEEKKWGNNFFLGERKLLKFQL
jgi:hypothetical protein